MATLVHVTTLALPETEGGDALPVTGLEIAGTPEAPMLYATSPAAAEMAAFAVPESGAATLTAALPLSPAPAAAGPAGPSGQALTLGNTRFWVSLDTGAHRVHLAREDAEGGLEPLDSLGAAEGLGIATPTQLALVETGGRAFAVVGSAGSSSLSVLEVTADGRLLAVDHIIDDLATRFSRVTSLETVTVDGRVYVLAGGADDGITLFEMLPDGRLVHLDTVEDSFDTGLTNVVALAATGANGVLQVFAGSEVEPGVTQFSVGLGPQGVVLRADPGGETLEGGTGNDLLAGGGGADRLFGAEGYDRLEGGAGADTLEGNAGQDSLWGDDGADTLLGGQGADALWGGDGDDLLRGQAGHDVLTGEAGDDTLQGGEGNDRLSGGLGDDLLTGGQGADVFVFAAGRDRVTDFALSVDRLELDAAALGLAGLTGAEVVARFATEDAGTLRLMFGAETWIELTGITNLGALEGAIDVI